MEYRASVARFGVRLSLPSSSLRRRAPRPLRSPHPSLLPPRRDRVLVAIRLLGLIVARTVEAGWRRGCHQRPGPPAPRLAVFPWPECIALTAAGTSGGFPNGHVGRETRSHRTPGCLCTHGGGRGPAPRTPRPLPRKGARPGSWVRVSLQGSAGASFRASPLLTRSCCLSVGSCGPTDAARQAERAG